MQSIDLREFVAAVAALVDRHRLAPGEYQRWRWPHENLERDLGVNPYGCADAANLLYTIGRFPPPREWPAWVAALRDQQDRASGLFTDPTHDPIHTTAHCIAALELFGAKPAHPLTALLPLGARAELEAFLDQLDWSWNPWGASHRGAGLYAALVLAGEVGDEWQQWYFDWLWHEADESTGLWRRGAIDAGGDALRFHHLAGTFHYLFNHEYARRPLPHPARLIDTCLDIRARRLFPLGRMVGFAEIDWIYCLTRSLRQCGHRFAECRQALIDFALDYAAYLCGLDPERDDGLNDLHQLFGAVSALAELQQALLGLLRTERPLQLVLDRRPFI